MKSISTQDLIKSSALAAAQHLFGEQISEKDITINQTIKDFEGDFTLVVFPLVRYSKLSPEKTAEAMGQFLVEKTVLFSSFNIVKGFLNLSFQSAFWIEKLNSFVAEEHVFTPTKKTEKVVLEYCGPNTNKPLHIGHLRNMMLGYAMSEVLLANGYDVTKVNIYNDRGIAICKSMAAYILEGNGATPASTGIKGDHFVGDYYVLFGKIVERQLRTKYNLADDAPIFKTIGKEREVAEQETEAFALAKSLLLKWEDGDAETMALWKQMNDWVLAGFQITFDVLGVDFEKDYFESETYKLGKDIIEEGLANKTFYKRADGAIAIDLVPDGLDEKVLLRGDGTSIYITQDLGTADERYKAYKMDRMIYVVGSEQDYHFKALKLCLQKMGKTWADGIYHLSYGMVESPTGRFKSREGKTADADDLIAEVLRIAEEKTKELGKIDDFTESEAKELYKMIGLGALKYFILRVNPYKKIIFNPEESIDFQGQTGPFIQYVHARIRSIIRKANTTPTSLDTATPLHSIERQLVILLDSYAGIIESASDKYDPSEIANFAYSLAKMYNKFYSELSILASQVPDAEKQLRIQLSTQIARTLKHAMKLLGIDVPEKM
jgi:arginyl-tRNA synthetase